MRNIPYIIWVILLFACVTGCSSTKNMTVDNSHIDKIVEEGYYNLKIDRVVTSSILYTRKLISDGYLKVEGEKVTANLPFFGKSYVADMIDAGIKINSTIRDLKIVKKNHAIDVKFVTGSSREYFDVFISIYSDSSFMLRINGSNREAISYTGTMMSIKH